MSLKNYQPQIISVLAFVIKLHLGMVLLVGGLSFFGDASKDQRWWLAIGGWLICAAIFHWAKILLQQNNHSGIWLIVLAGLIGLVSINYMSDSEKVLYVGLVYVFLAVSAFLAWKL